MNKSLVLTTIFPPRKDVYRLSKVKDFNLIVVGDKKTPDDWSVKNSIYLSPENQIKLFPKFSKVLPWNLYARKNLGYLYAISEKSDIIGETDDDVSPYKNFPPKLTKITNVSVLSHQKFINIYPYFGAKSVWPRGFPLDEITQKQTVKKTEKKVRGYIYNSVIDKDSDFDAIYRLISDKPVKFTKKKSFALGKGSYCPLNSQCTFFYPEAYMLLYIPSLVNQRVEDILRGYIAQRLLWEINGNLVFAPTTTFTSNRNAHNYLKDFQCEMPLYLLTKQLISVLDSLSLSKDLGKSLIKVYSEISKIGIVKKEETEIVTEWVKTVEKISS